MKRIIAIQNEELSIFFVDFKKNKIDIIIAWNERMFICLNSLAWLDVLHVFVPYTLHTGHYFKIVPSLYMELLLHCLHYFSSPSLVHVRISYSKSLFIACTMLYIKYVGIILLACCHVMCVACYILT